MHGQRHHRQREVSSNINGLFVWSIKYVLMILYMYTCRDIHGYIHMQLICNIYIYTSDECCYGKPAATGLQLFVYLVWSYHFMDDLGTPIFAYLAYLHAMTAMLPPPRQQLGSWDARPRGCLWASWDARIQTPRITNWPRWKRNLKDLGFSYDFNTILIRF